MKKIIAFLIFFSAITFSLFSQNENDALRYSLVNYGGTARFMGLSGAYGAVGADISSLSQNPAGIGFYRKSEFTITPMLNNSSIESSFYDGKNNDYRNTLYLGNLGYVMAMNVNSSNDNQLKQLQFGFGINRMSTFSNRMIVGGFNTDNSLLTGYMNEVNATGAPLSEWDDFGAGLAYDVNLFFYDSTNNIWSVDMPGGYVEQLKTITTKGSTSETVLSLGGNFGDKLFLGITFAFPEIKFEEESVYTEEDTDGNNTYFDSFKRTEYLKTTGSGFNFKFGFIYKPFDFLRIGGAFHTPTNYYKMSDDWNASMTAWYDAGDKYSYDSPEGAYDYKLTTPMRAMGSIAVIIGQVGLISADYEFVDYSTARLHADDYNFADENKIINDNLTTANNLRLGTEWKAGVYAFRGGYSLYGSPYKNGGSMGEKTGYSFGFGIHDKGYFLDFAYNHLEYKDNYFLYNDSNPASNKYKNNSYSITLGFRF